MMTADPYAKEITPPGLLKQQEERDKKQQKIKALRTKIRGIEKKITDLRRIEAPESKVTPWRQSWDYHTAELKKLEKENP